MDTDDEKYIVGLVRAAACGLEPRRYQVPVADLERKAPMT